MIIILTAPIRSGKTTSLIKWSEGKDDVYGILTPVVDGKRVFKDIATKEEFPMETAVDKDALTVGNFVFSKAGFEKAILIIQVAIRKKGWLIIDEIGPLELRGEGFHDILKEVLRKRKEKIVLVVREGLAQSIQDHFRIDAIVVTTIENL